MTYILSDIHGMYKEFREILSLTKFNDNDKLYILGDAIDRGPQSIACLKYIMNHKNMKMILGNHEDMMYNAIVKNKQDFYNCWMYNGGYTTLEQFDNCPKEDQDNIIYYIGSLKQYIILDKYILVHAGIDTTLKFNNIDELLKKQNKDVVIWERNSIQQNKLGNYIVIFGHTPTYYFKKQIPMKIFHQNGYIGIDCGACFKNGQIGCLRLDDMSEFYVETKL